MGLHFLSTCTHTWVFKLTVTLNHRHWVYSRNHLQNGKFNHLRGRLDNTGGVPTSSQGASGPGRKEVVTESTGWRSVPKLRPRGSVLGNLRRSDWVDILFTEGSPGKKKCQYPGDQASLSGLLSFSKPLIEAPAFPTVACLVRFGVSNTSTRFLPFLKNLLQLPTCQTLWPAFHAPISCCLPASIRPFSLLQTLWASLLLCLCSLRCNGREPVNFRGGRATFKALWHCDILMKLEGLLWVIWLNESNRNDTMWLPKLDNKNITQFPFCAFESGTGTGCPHAGVLANSHCQLPDRWMKNTSGESIPQISSHPAIIPSWGLTPWNRDELPWSTEFMW